MSEHNSIDSSASFNSIPPVLNFTNIVDLTRQIEELEDVPYIALNLFRRPVKFYANALHRLVQAAEDTSANITFAYFREREPDGTLRDHPLIDFQYGSVRDSFDFGAVVLLDVGALKSSLPTLLIQDYTTEEYPDGGWYALRCDLSFGPVCLVQEYLYEVPRSEFRDSGERQHDYVNPSAEAYQKAMERICLRHLGIMEAYISTPPEKVDLTEGEFPVTASVIIPVRNRVRTIGDAVASALSQKTDFDFNVIVVDNDSTDGTSEVLASIADDRLHILKADKDEGLGIGGCWNKALQSSLCGRFAVQLDSDDIYSSENTLRKIIDCFAENECGMVVGSYTLTDFNLTPLGKGIVDHKEWTDLDGRNNALRVNGFGAPRAFFTPVARNILFPNVSYGEDYAMCLAISRRWKVGRIYESLYFCRRWEGNSDARLSIEKENEHNYYKDFIRTMEIMRRVKDSQEDDINTYKDSYRNEDRQDFDIDEDEYDGECDDEEYPF